MTEKTVNQLRRESLIWRALFDSHSDTILRLLGVKVNPIAEYQSHWEAI